MTHTDQRHPPLGAALHLGSEFPRLNPGDVVGRYRIVERIGEGGMAEVFRATLQGELGYQKQVVLKLVLPEHAADDEYIDMFLDECRLVAGLSHPNLPQTYELGRHEGRHFLAMEYVNGVSLGRMVKRARELGFRLPVDVTLKLVGQLLECLQYVHGVAADDGRPMNIVHRDVSPGNLLVTDDGFIKLLDFGIARARLQAHRTAAGQVKGKMGFMSPEQSRGEPVDLRTDLYATGTLLYLLTLGVGPFEHLSDLFAVVRACAMGDFRPPRALEPDLDEELERIMLKALALSAVDRYGSAGSMLDALEALALKLRVMPSSRGVARVMHELFPERVPAPRVVRRRSSVSQPVVLPPPVPPPLPPRPPADSLEEPPTAVAAPSATRPVPPVDTADEQATARARSAVRRSAALFSDDDLVSTETAREGFQAPVDPVKRWPRHVVAAIAAGALLLLGLGLWALTPADPPPAPPIPVPHFRPPRK